MNANKWLCVYIVFFFFCPCPSSASSVYFAARLKRFGNFERVFIFLWYFFVFFGVVCLCHVLWPWIDYQSKHVAT